MGANLGLSNGFIVVKPKFVCPRHGEIRQTETSQFKAEKGLLVKEAPIGKMGDLDVPQIHISFCSLKHSWKFTSFVKYTIGYYMVEQSSDHPYLIIHSPCCWISNKQTNAMQNHLSGSQFPSLPANAPSETKPNDQLVYKEKTVNNAPL